MLKQFAPVGFFLLFATCSGACQNALPNAPSAQPAMQVRGLNTFPVFATFTPRVIESAAAWRQSALVLPENSVLNPKRTNTFLERYLNPAVPRRLSSEPLSESTSLMGRASNAAARVFLTRDETGRERVNTSYFVRALTAVAADTASRPYWRRSATGPVSDLGSTMGNDAGLNLLHEFQPGIEHLMKNHAPRFVLKMIGEHVSHN
jgi:hypothetical protein